MQFRAFIFAILVVAALFGTVSAGDDDNKGDGDEGAQKDDS